MAVIRIFSKPSQNLHLQGVDGVNVGVAHVYEVPQHLVVLAQLVVSSQLQQA